MIISDNYTIHASSDTHKYIGVEPFHNLKWLLLYQFHTPLHKVTYCHKRCNINCDFLNLINLDQYN